MLDDLTTLLNRGTTLNDPQVSRAIQALTDETISPETKAAFLTALAAKGETIGEIAAFARELRERSVPPPLEAATRAQVILDVVGTGGDRVGTFNLSTTAALIAAAVGVKVAKHGNRAITSQAGSADVLEELGVPIDLPPAQAAESLRTRGFAFFFAPKYHPAFKHIAPARKLCAERGQRTIFNLLGPLLNPARPTAQLMGVPRPDLCEPLGRVLQSLGVRRGMVVCGEAGRPAAGAGPAVHLDELSTLGPNTVAEFYQEHGFALSVLAPGDLPLQPASLADLLGGDRQTNARIVRRLLRGEERGPKRDALLLNAGAALFVAGRVRSIVEGWELAASVIDSGQAAAKLAELATNTRATAGSAHT